MGPSVFTINRCTPRIFLTLVGKMDVQMRQTDVIIAYLNADMTDEVYVWFPRIFAESRDKVSHLLKALHGYPKSGQLWNHKFVMFMTNLCFFDNLSSHFFLFCT